MKIEIVYVNEGNREFIETVSGVKHIVDTPYYMELHLNDTVRAIPKREFDFIRIFKR